mgnify:CR=1 FL=1
MAISVVGAASGPGNTTTTFTITLPATAVDDIIVLEYTHRGTGDGSLSGTYTGGAATLKHSQLYASSAFSGKTWWSRATGNHTGETVIVSGLTNSCAGICTIYRGALASGDPLADATVVGEQNAAANETQAQITTATNGAYVVLVVANSPDVAISSQACTSPTLVERIEKLSIGGTDTSIAHASGEKATAGATGAFTWTQTDGASGSWAYAIQPAAGAVQSGPHVGTAIGIATRGLQTNLFRAVIAVGVPTRTLLTTLGAQTATNTGIATSTAQIIFIVTAAATAIGSAVAATAITFATNATVAAVGLATAASQFIAGAGGSVLHPAWCYLNRALRFMRGVLPQVTSDQQTELYDGNTQPSATSPRSPQV